VLDPTQGCVRFPDSHPKPTALISTTTDFRFTVDAFRDYSNDYMVIDTANSAIPTPQLFRRSGTVYYHIANIPTSGNITDGETFGPIRRVQSELNFKALGLAQGNFGHKGTFMSINSGEFPIDLTRATRA